MVLTIFKEADFRAISEWTGSSGDWSCICT